MQKNWSTRMSVGLLAAATLLPLAATPAIAQADKPAPLKLKVGDIAPDFKLQYFDGTGLKNVDLSQFRGKQNVIVAFYVFAFTGG